MRPNPFMLGMAVFNVAAAIWYLYGGGWKMAGVVMCYAVSSALLAFIQA